MKMLPKMSYRAQTGLLASAFVSVLTGCGVVYTSQEFKRSNLTYGVKGDFDIKIEVIPLTFTSARIANSGKYTPRSLPDEFHDIDTVATDKTLRDRLLEGGIYDVTPALELEPPAGPPSFDAAREVVPPVFLDDNTQPLPIAEPLYLPLPAPPYEGSSAPSYAPVNIINPSVVPLKTPPVLLEVQGASSVSTPSARVQIQGRQELDSLPNSDFGVLLERPQLRQSVADTPLPYTEPFAYRIGPGDELRIQFSPIALPSASGQLTRQATDQRLSVQDDGKVFIPEIGIVSVGGLTLPEARKVIRDQLVASGAGLNPAIQIVRFDSKSVSISGLNEAKEIPITTRPVTLGEAIISVGGFGPKPGDTVIRVLRKGRIYEMTGDRILASTEVADRILLDGDLVAVISGYNSEAALAYFDQQLRLRDNERNEEASRRAIAQDLRAEAAEQRAEAADQRAEEQMSRTAEMQLLDRVRLELELRATRLEADRLARKVEIERLRSQRQADQRNETARIANVEARQSYLNSLRSLENLNREALAQVRRETRETLLANQAERVRARADRLQIIEIELRQELASLESTASNRREARSLFAERLGLGDIERDYITVAGETRRQIAIPLPFGSHLTLNRVLYQSANGINPVSGNTSEIYVIRTMKDNRMLDRVIAYHLDASNPAALAVAGIFEMRPNDVVYVNPQPITTWNRVLTQILPSTGLLQSGISAASGIGN